MRWHNRKPFKIDSIALFNLCFNCNFNNRKPLENNNNKRKTRKYQILTTFGFDVEQFSILIFGFFD